jgi:O-antigen ligase
MLTSYIKKFKEQPAEGLLVICLGLAPTGLLFVRQWFEVFFSLASLISVWLLVRGGGSAGLSNHSRWVRIFAAVFCLPILAILISQQIRDDFDLARYDAPSRFVFAIPILLVLIKRCISIRGVLEWVLPLSLILTVAAWHWLPKTNWAVDPNRLTTYFIDPLSFGRLCLELGLLSLLMMGRCAGRSTVYCVLLNGLKLTAVVIGLGFSIYSDSRTGWFALPLVFYFYLVKSLPMRRLYSTLVAALLIIVTSVGFYSLSSHVHDRVQLAWQEVMNYKMSEVNPDVSVGMRMSFARMGWYYFKLQPLAGWGDKGFAGHVNDPAISSFATQFTREFALTAGFHNEITTNAVRSGIWGLISSLALFLVPLVFFARVVLQGGAGSTVAFLGFCYVLMEFIAGMSTEVLNLKFTATFYACMLALWVAATLNAKAISVQSGEIASS